MFLVGLFAQRNKGEEGAIDFRGSSVQGGKVIGMLSIGWARPAPATSAIL